ncbi:MAG: hypothetical protein M5U26_12305 [Planctomycetota bacterium]|nr:hypothetical protein [Planctomycetota bacterium]
MLEAQPEEELTGYLLDFKDGSMKIRPDGALPDRTLSANEVRSMQFLKPRTEPPRPPAKGPEGETPDRPHRPFLPNNGELINKFLQRGVLGRGRIGNATGLVLLPPDERRRYLELTFSEFRGTLNAAEEAELKRLEGQVQKMSHLHDELRRADEEKRVPQYLESHRQALARAGSTLAAREHVAALFIAYVRGENETVESVERRLSADLERIEDPAVREAMKGELSDLTKFLKRLAEEPDDPRMKTPFERRMLKDARERAKD